MQLERYCNHCLAWRVCYTDDANGQVWLCTVCENPCLDEDEYPQVLDAYEEYKDQEVRELKSW